MAKIKVRASHVDTNRAYRQVRARHGVDELDDAVAVTVASWWQSPGSVGRYLAALASGAEVDGAQLADDIAKTRQDHGYYTHMRGVNDGRMSRDDRMALDALSTWITKRTNAGRHDYRPDAPIATRYASIVFQQGDDAEETLTIISNDGESAGLAHLTQWHNDSGPYAYESYDDPPHGTDDSIYIEGELIMSYSHHYGYAGLSWRYSV